jgi:hypothetical protein
MDNKRRFYLLLERYVNEMNKESVEAWYGEGSIIKVNNVTFTQKTRSIVIEITIVLGKIISETVMNEKMAIALISEGMGYFFPELSLHVIHSWDS